MTPLNELKKGCGKRYQIGYNSVLNCPINIQCGLTDFCPTCQALIKEREDVLEMIEYHIAFWENITYNERGYAEARIKIRAFRKLKQQLKGEEKGK